MTGQCIAQTIGEKFALYHGDCVEVIKGIPDKSVHLSVSSLPFSDQYSYSDSLADFGNCDGDAAFFAQLDFLIPDLFRVTLPGRFAIVHAKDRLVYGTKNNGFRCINDFTGDVIRAMVRHGWLYFGRITVATDPVRENAQTNNLPFGQLQPDGDYTGLQEDASRYGVGMPEYLLLFRRPHTPTAVGGQRSDVPVNSLRPEEGYSLPRWQIDANSLWRSSGQRLLLPWEQAGYDYHAHIAYLERLDERRMLGRANGEPIPTDHPWVWWDIQRTATLNTRLVQKKPDEKHICPLQTDLTERCITRWSNPGEVVLDYFAGIGTVPYMALKLGRLGVGVELKPEYYDVAADYLGDLELQQAQRTLFDHVAEEAA